MKLFFLNNLFFISSHFYSPLCRCSLFDLFSFNTFSGNRPQLCYGRKAKIASTWKQIRNYSKSLEIGEKSTIRYKNYFALFLPAYQYSILRKANILLTKVKECPTIVPCQIKCFNPCKCLFDQSFQLHLPKSLSFYAMYLKLYLAKT